MKKVVAYLTDPTVKPATQTCRLKVWAHDNAFTMFWAQVVQIVLLVLILVFK
jgi:hypothetical protein